MSWTTEDRTRSRIRSLTPVGSSASWTAWCKIGQSPRPTWSLVNHNWSSGELLDERHEAVGLCVNHFGRVRVNDNRRPALLLANNTVRVLHSPPSTTRKHILSLCLTRCYKCFTHTDQVLSSQTRFLYRRYVMRMNDCVMKWKLRDI